MIEIANKHMDHTVSVVELLVLFFNFEVCVHPTLTSQLVYQKMKILKDLPGSNMPAVLEVTMQSECDKSLIKCYELG
jgi:hypothetical protein